MHLAIIFRDSASAFFGFRANAYAHPQENSSLQRHLPSLQKQLYNTEPFCRMKNCSQYR